MNSTNQERCINPNCESTKIYAKDRCNACYRYYLKYETDRLQELCGRILGRHQKDKPRWCKNCGSPEITSNLRCNACRIYHQRHKKERPRHLWDVDAKCKTCGVPLQTVSYGCSGYCGPCDSFRKRGKQRPKELWGIGEFGWCDCGRPATIEFDGFPCCKLCKPKD